MQGRGSATKITKHVNLGFLSSSSRAIIICSIPLEDSLCRHSQDSLHIAAIPNSYFLASLGVVPAAPWITRVPIPAQWRYQSLWYSLNYPMTRLCRVKEQTPVRWRKTEVRFRTTTFLNACLRCVSNGARQPFSALIICCFNWNRYRISLFPRKPSHYVRQYKLDNVLLRVDWTADQHWLELYYGWESIYPVAAYNVRPRAWAANDQSHHSI